MGGCVQQYYLNGYGFQFALAIILKLSNNIINTVDLPYFVYILLAGFVLLGIWLRIKWFRMYGGKDGERHARQRAQGNFIPLSKEEIADDRARSEGRGN